MKVIILAGGRGSRISEETSVKPKPMVLINNKPLLWHIMNIYSKQGFIDFVIATGYKGEVINDWINTIKKVGVSRHSTRELILKREVELKSV
jgi:glucose-1-phosphate cytidylyltransferase